MYYHVFITIECDIEYKDCKDWLDRGEHRNSGTYPIKPDDGGHFQVNYY